MADGNQLLHGSPLSLDYGTGDDGTRSESAAGDNGGTGSSVWKAWALLVVAILLEVAGTTAMKLSDGFSYLLPSVLIYVLYALSLTVFPFSLKAIELSTAYAVWSGLGTTVTSIIGFVYFKDTVGFVKIAALTAIIGGCVVLKFADDVEEVDVGDFGRGRR
mmetsp:Transcript_13974/g.30367  ORF Transcript_13974/g.30367 Transcript_13974/m.30367 type:complete len:161 (-) Transcript_13974:169-651(-)